MQFPLSSSETMLWLGATAILLLVTSEIISPYYGQIGLVIDRKRLRLIALSFFILFLLGAMVQIYEIFTY